MQALPLSTFDRHNTCLTCGYDLFGQPRSGQCPECGTSVRETSTHEAFLSVPGNVARLRSGSMYLLISSVLCGLCPGVCLFYLADQGIVWASVMTLIFAATAFTAAVGEIRLTAILVETGESVSAPRLPRASDVFAAVGLGFVNLSAYVYLIDQHEAAGRQVATMILAGLGFLLLACTAWRSAESGRLQARVADACLRRGKSGLHGLGIFKAFYETIWLGTCFLTIAVGLANNDAAIFVAFAALIGLMGFGIVWLLMIIFHAVLFVRIRKHAGVPASYGFEVVMGNNRSDESMTKPQ